MDPRLTLIASEDRNRELRRQAARRRTRPTRRFRMRLRARAAVTPAAGRPACT